MSFAEVEPIDEIREPPPPSPIDMYAKVAIVQWNPVQAAPIRITPDQAWTFKLGNLQMLSHYVRQAAQAGAKLVVLPEFATIGYPDIPELPSEDDNFRTREDLAPYVEVIPGPTTNYLGALAKELGIYLQIGMAEVDATTQHYHNSATVVGPEGTVLATHRKVHLYQLEYQYLQPGPGPTFYEAPWGLTGIVICSDLFDSHLMQAYRAEGTRVLAMSTSWAAYNSGWYAFTAAARHGLAYFVAANHSYFPDSGVINPDGTTQSHIRQSDGVAYGYLPLQQVGFGPLPPSGKEADQQRGQD